MEKWAPHLLNRYDRVVALLVKARREGTTDSLKAEIDDAINYVVPRLPDDIFHEKIAKTGAGRPGVKAVRRSREYAANNDFQSVSDFDAPLPGAQPGQFAYPPPAAIVSIANQPFQFSIQQVPGVNYHGIAQAPAPGGSESPDPGYLFQENYFHGENISKAAGSNGDDTSPSEVKPDRSVAAEFIQYVDEFSAHEKEQQQEQERQAIAPPAFYSHIGNKHFNAYHPQFQQQPMGDPVPINHFDDKYFLQQQQQSMNAPAPNHQVGPGNLLEPQQPTYFDPFLGHCDPLEDAEPGLSEVAAWNEQN